MQCLRNHAQVDVPEELHLHLDLVWMTRSWMLMPNRNEIKRSLKRGWVYFAWERGVNYCSWRLEEWIVLFRYGCTSICRPTCSSYNVMSLLVHQEAGSILPLCECVWTRDYSRRATTRLLSYIRKGDRNLPILFSGCSSLGPKPCALRSQAVMCGSSQGLSWGPSQQEPTHETYKWVPSKWLKSPAFMPFQLMPSGVKKKCSCWALPKSQIRQQNKYCHSSHNVLGWFAIDNGNGFWHQLDVKEK